MAWYFVFKKANFQQILRRYSDVCMNQASLMKVTSRKELLGKKQTDSKSVYQQNLNEIALLKKEFFKVSKVPARLQANIISTGD